MQQPKSSPGPVRHIVMWNIAGETPAEKQVGMAAVRREFESLRGQIPGMVHLEIGVDHSGVSYACDMVLVTEFESAGALAAYAMHPAHLAACKRLEGVRTTRHQVDYAGPVAVGR